MRLPLLLASAIALAACSAPQAPSEGIARAPDAPDQAHGLTGLHSPLPTRAPRAIAGLPDSGRLVAYSAATAIRHGAYTWHPAEISEAHALRAIVTGEMTMDAPDGTPIRLKYDHHIEHKDGNWTWIGRPEGGQPGMEAIITFGDKAVFGSVPYGYQRPLRIGSNHGRVWVMETDLKKLAALGPSAPRGHDFLVPQALRTASERAIAQAAAQPQSLTPSGAVPESATVDLVIGYTGGFAARLGGASQANTRLTNMVDIANQAFVNSQIVARVRLVGTVALNYPDSTNNDSTLRELTGCPDANCSSGDAPVPAALQPLRALRVSKHADLMSLVRNLDAGVQGGCGIAWLLGGGLSGIRHEDAYAGVSVVSDTSGIGSTPGSYCRDETLAHELGHNLGSQHDADTADSDNNGLTDNERGAFPYSLGYKTVPGAGNFFTIMAYDDGQYPVLVFSNPRINICGGYPCGVAEQADNARSIGQTVSTVAGFAPSIAAVRTRSDFDGDRDSDLVWHNNSSGANTIWRSANSSTTRAVTSVPNTAWRIAGSGDFNGDGTSDLIWRNASTGQNTVWYAGMSTSAANLGNAPSPWVIAGIGDFNGDGLDDLLWRNPTTGQNAIWRSGSIASPQAMATVGSPGWAIVGVGDFDGDQVDDVLWRNANNGVNSLWRSGNANTTLAITAVANTGWVVAGVGDFNGDGRADILWRNAGSGGNVIWRAANSGTTQSLPSTPAAWTIAGVADFNGDGDADIFWRNTSSYAATIWRSGDAATNTPVTTVANPQWVVRS